MITVSTSLDRQAQDRMPDEWLASPTGDADIVAGDYPIGIAGFTEKFSRAPGQKSFFSTSKMTNLEHFQCPLAGPSLGGVFREPDAQAPSHQLTQVAV